MAEALITPKKPTKTDTVTPKLQSEFFRHVILPSKTYREKPKLSSKNTAFVYTAQPSLKRADTEKFRNSLQRQLSIEMLIKGYHQSFRELCSLLAWQKRDRERLGVEHPHHNRPLLDTEPEKMNFLCTRLNKIEDSERKKQYSNVYRGYQELAEFYMKTDDHWLSDLFYKKCLSLAQAHSQMNTQLIAEAYLNVGLMYERKGKLLKALDYFESYRKWSQDYYDLRVDANLQLTRFYIKLSEHHQGQQALEYVIKAYQASEQSYNEKIKNETSYKLGYTYLEQEDIESALKYFHQYYDFCQQANDHDAFVQASEALAICYQKKEDVEKTTQYLNRCMENVSDKENDDNYARACSIYALIEATFGRYDTAIDSSSKAYSIALANNSADLSRYRVLHGINRGLKLRSMFNEYVNKMNERELILWKSLELEDYLKKLMRT